MAQSRFEIEPGSAPQVRVRPADPEPSQKKRRLGQFFTLRDSWLTPAVRRFIRDARCSTAYDPFAGTGEILRAVSKLGVPQVRGLDLDEGLGWTVNDSLVKIPHLDDALVVTNPPYLSSYSAKRRHLSGHTAEYFRRSKYDDLYLIALERLLEAQSRVVAIVPETFIHTSFPKERLVLVNILEDSPFSDTENPVCVACFDGEVKSLDTVQVFKNTHSVASLGQLEALRMIPSWKPRIEFNSLAGEIGLRAVDMTTPTKRIRFMRRDELHYDPSGIKQSSRLVTFVRVGLKDRELDRFLALSNDLLERFRAATEDVLLSPFKGNMTNGVRRRRLDYETARAIMERALVSMRSDLRAEGRGTLPALPF